MNTGRFNFFLKGLIVFAIFGVLFYFGFVAKAQTDVILDSTIATTTQWSGTEGSTYSTYKVATSTYGYSMDLYGYGTTTVYFFICESNADVSVGADWYNNLQTPKVGCFNATELYEVILPNGFGCGISEYTTCKQTLTFSEPIEFLSSKYYWFLITNNSVNPHNGLFRLNLTTTQPPQGESTGVTNQWLYFDLFGIGVDLQGEVEVIELPDPGEVVVQTGYDDFYFEEYVTCMVGDTDCAIRFVYSYDDIGSLVLLLPETATSVLNYVDIIEDLPDQSALEETLTPTTRYASTTDQYRIFVIPDTGSTTLYEMVNVEWVDDLSEDNFGLFNSIISKFKNIFPLSILLQIKQHVNSLSQEDVAKISINFNDLIPAEWSGVTNTDPLLAEELLTDNLPIWSTHIYPLLKTIIWFMAWLYIIFRIKSLFASDNPDD